MKLSARDIQVFVAGALALPGFHSLLWAPYYVIYSQYLLVATGMLFAAVAFLIGLALLFNYAHAVFWAQIYLLLEVIGSLVMLGSYAFAFFPKWPHLSWWQMVSNLLAPVILLGLLLWSRSLRLNELNSTAVNH